MDKQSTQKRILIATLISFAFFVAYDYFYLMPEHKAKQEQMKLAAKEKNISKEANVSTQAPQTTTNTAANNAPVTVHAQSKVLSTIETKLSTITIDNLGRISQVTLKDEQYKTTDGKSIQLFAPDQLKPLEIRFSDANVNEQAFKVDFNTSAQKIDASQQATELVLTQSLSDMNITKKIKFYPDGHYDLVINVTKPLEFFVTPGFRPNVLADMYADHGSLLKMSDNTLTIVEDEDLEKTQNFLGVKVASAFDRYHATFLYNLSSPMNVYLMPDNKKSPQIFIASKGSFNGSGYAGPKEYKLLNNLNPELTDVIEYGWFTFIAKPMFTFLQYLYDLTGNWGWAIVLITIIVKLILYPLSYKGMVSMQKLKELAPKIKEIQEKYKGDSQKAGVHMMELYKKHEANPMGGCLPILLQIPIFFAIYRVLLNAIELEGAEWILWINNLAIMDPYFILPILMGATMFLQQKITPTTITDPVQQKMFQWLPVIFTVFFLWFPAGLTLYWFVNNLFTVGQQYYVNKLFEKQKNKKSNEAK